jgi:PAS domain-containing protein
LAYWTTAAIHLVMKAAPSSAEVAKPRERRRPELAALRRENELLRATLDAVDGTIVVSDADRRYVLANRAYREHFPHLRDDAARAGRR